MSHAKICALLDFFDRLEDTKSHKDNEDQVTNSCVSFVSFCSNNIHGCLCASFIDVPRDSHFPIQNLPFGVFQPKQAKPRVGVAIGDLIVDLSVLEELGHFRSSEFQGSQRTCVFRRFA